jgi:hypothetical protein
MGCAYTGSAGGPIRTEIPMPICAADGVDSDKTETDNSKNPRTNPDTYLRTGRFISLPFFESELFGRWARGRSSGLITFRPYKPRTFVQVARMHNLVSNQRVSEDALRRVRGEQEGLIFQDDVSQSLLSGMGE